MSHPLSSGIIPAPVLPFRENGAIDWDMLVHRLGPLARICWRHPIRDYRVRTKYTLMKQGVLKNYVVRAPFPTILNVDREDIDKAFVEFNLNDPIFLPAGEKFVEKPKASAKELAPAK